MRRSYTQFICIVNNVVIEHAAWELCVDSKFLLSGKLFLHIYVFNDIPCHL